MRNPFKLSILAIALAMTGCSSQSKPVELGTVASQNQYDDQIQDGLGAQRYTEAQLLAQRQFNEFQGQLDELEAKRRELDAAINARAYENGVMEAPASSAEADRISEYQEASKALQQRVAEANSRLLLQLSRVENQRDQDLLFAEREAARRIAEAEDQERKMVQMKQVELAKITSEADARLSRRVAEIKSDLEAQKAGIVARARTDIASLSADAEKAKATVVAPVVTARAVYTGTPTATISRQPEVRETPTKPRRDTTAPVLTVNRFEPQVKASPSVPTKEELGGEVLAVGAGVHSSTPSAPVAPLVIVAKTRSVYDVFYVYKDESSWTRFQSYLKAYGISDFVATHNNAAGEFLIYCGRYYNEEEAGSRVSYLNSKTSTKHVQVRETQVPI